MKFTFIRHAESQVDPKVPIKLWGLTPAGVTAATRLGAEGAIKDLDVIYSSLQTKAIETMLYLAKPNHLPMRTHSDLTEITSFTNEFIGPPDFERKVEQYFTGELDRIADGETFEEATTRFTRALNEIIASEPDATNIGVVAHGSILAFFTTQYADILPVDLHPRIRMPDVAVFDWETKKFSVFWGDIHW